MYKLYIVHACVFVDVFLQHCGPNRPQCLILDGHHSHEVLDLLVKAKDENIFVLALPPHTSHWLQPLDKGVFGPLKKHFNVTCSEFMAESPSNVIVKATFAKVFTTAWQKAITPENIKQGFKVTGIFPFNPQAIPAIAYAPAAVYAGPSVSAADAAPSVLVAAPSVSIAAPSASVAYTPATIYAAPSALAVDAAPSVSVAVPAVSIAAPSVVAYAPATIYAPPSALAADVAPSVSVAVPSVLVSVPSAPVATPSALVGVPATSASPAVPAPPTSPGVMVPSASLEPLDLSKLFALEGNTTFNTFTIDTDSTQDIEVHTDILELLSRVSSGEKVLVEADMMVPPSLATPIHTPFPNPSSIIEDIVNFKSKNNFAPKKAKKTDGGHRVLTSEAIMKQKLEYEQAKAQKLQMKEERKRKREVQIEKKTKPRKNLTPK